MLVVLVEEGAVAVGAVLRRIHTTLQS